MIKICDKLVFSLCLWICFGAFFSAAQAKTVYVAVASNFTLPMKEIAAEFEKQSGHDLKLSFSSSAKVYAQIKQGAPFQVFLSADQDKPLRLEQEQLGLKGTRFTYATGRLALWSARSAYVDSAGQILSSGSYKHLALANPRLAPYGLAAMDVINHMKLKPQLQSKVVQGENIAQTYQFIASGNAELGFVAYSQIIKSKKGSFWLVPPEYHRPIRQDALLLSRAKNDIAAQAFMHYLQSSQAKAIIRAFGYQV